MLQSMSPRQKLIGFIGDDFVLQSRENDVKRDTKGVKRKKNGKLKSTKEKAKSSSKVRKQ